MGGHGHGHDHHHEVKIPDYRIYKIDNCPELLDVKRALAAKGLCDPWLRNEVWRYNPKEFSTHAQRFKGFFFRGFGLGLAAFAVTIGAEFLYKKMSPEDEHGHGHH